MSVRHTSAILVSLLLLLPSEVRAEPDDGDRDPDKGIEVGLLVGGGFYQINAPADPAGALTFLYGSAFSGGGFSIGGTGVFDLHRFFGLGADLSLTYTSIEGFAETDFARRDVSIDEYAVRLTVLARFRYALPNPELEIAVGPEVAFSLSSGMTETLRGQITVADRQAEPLEPAGSVSFFGVAQAGLGIKIGRFTVPLYFRAGWNPFYPDTTADRFESFRSPDDPGPFAVGADWYLLWLTGARIEL